MKLVKKLYFFIFVIFISMNTFITTANALAIQTSNIKIVENNIGLENVDISNGEITSNLKFEQENDYVIFKITLKNNEQEKYTIESITDNNKNKNLNITYEYDSNIINENSNYSFTMKMIYKKQLENVEKIDIDDLKVTINFKTEDGTTKKIVITNPKTSDNILKYLLLIILSLTGLVFVQKKKKIGKIITLSPLLLMPFVIFAYDNYITIIKFKSIEIKGVMLPYEITFDIPGGSINRTLRYGDEIGELPTVDKDGYEFLGWEDENGNLVDEHTIVTKGLKIRPRYRIIEYTITYNLDGGTANNLSKYNVETDTFTLNTPTKSGYNFSGWTGSNGDVLQPNVVIEKGSTGNKTYTANYSVKDNITYTVIHRKQKEDLSGYVVFEEEHLIATAFSTIKPSTKTYEGYDSPEPRNLYISEDGQASITYDYDIKVLSVSINIEGGVPINRELRYGDRIGELPTLEKPGYRFVGFVDGNGNPVTSDTIVTKKLTLIPVFEPVSFNLTLDLNGGSYEDGKSNPASYNIESNILIENPIRDNCTFIGWTQPGSDELINTLVIQPGSTGDKSYIANYSKNIEDLMITIDAENIVYDGTHKKPNVSVKDDSTTLIENEDYVITYSNDINAGSATVRIVMKEEKNENTGLIYTGVKEIPYTIKKAENTCAITNMPTLDYPTNINGLIEYNCNGDGEISITDSNNLITASDITLSSANLTISNKGETNITITQYEGNNYKNATVSQNIVINPSYYTVTFDPNSEDSSGTMENQQILFQKSANLNANNYTRERYVFDSWNTKTDGTGTKYNDTVSISLSEDTILYAQWKEKTATLDRGYNFNKKIRNLSGEDITTNLLSVNNENITAIIKTNVKPDLSLMTEDNIVSSSTSLAPIYAWYDNGTIYLYTITEDIYLSNDSGYLFMNLINLTNINLNNFITSNVTNMSNMFMNCKKLMSLDLSTFDTSKVTFMSSMFYKCSGLMSLDLGDNFDISNVITINGIFSECSSLTSLDLGDKFDTSNVTDMNRMFMNCKELTSLDLGNKFDTSNVTNMSFMFSECSSLTALDLGNKFDTSNVTDMNNMFYRCLSLTTLILGDKFDTSNVTNMSFMFMECKKLTSLDLGNKFDTTKVTTMRWMFLNCENLTTLDLGDKFDTSNVTDMSSMFHGCTSLTTLDLGNKFDTSKVTGLSAMFSGCSSLTTLDLGDKFNTSNVTNMNALFSGCTNLRTIYISESFNTTNVSKHSNVFNNCTSLVGGEGTTYDSNNIELTYAHIDESGNPGYFTRRPLDNSASIAKFINKFKSNNIISKYILYSLIVMSLLLSGFTILYKNENRQ